MKPAVLAVRAPASPDEPLDSLCGRFEAALRAGTASSLEQWLPGEEGPRSAALVELVRLDLEYRLRRGDSAKVEDYLSRFPELHANPVGLLRVLNMEWKLRRIREPDLSQQEYRQRFPTLVAHTLWQYIFVEDTVPELVPLSQGLRTGARSPTGSQECPTAESSPVVIGGKYQVVRLLGRGGQSTVYQAFDTDLGREVVVKVSRQLVPTDPLTLDHLLDEGRILANLNHPNLARVYDFGFHEGQPFLVMEYIRGRNLEQYARDRKLEPRHSAALVAQVARVVALIHAHGIIHLDIKPQNILINESGEPFLVDFGLARLRSVWMEETEPAGGTIAYLSPEQAKCEMQRIGARSDVFALGAVLYRLLVGRAPFAGDNASLAYRRALDCDFDRTALGAADVPRALGAICTRAMADNPDQRYPGAQDLAKALDRYLRRPRLAVLLGGLGLVAILIVLAVFGVGHLRTAPPGKPMTIRVWQNERFVDLLRAPPLRFGDELQIQAESPAGQHLSLFLVNSKGVLEHVADFPPRYISSSIIHPGQGKTVALTGPPGTELLFLVGRRSGPVGAAELRQLWGEESWPPLPERTILRLERDRVDVIGGRDLGQQFNRSDPTDEVERRLESLRLQLTERFPYVSGLAFSHGQR